MKKITYVKFAIDILMAVTFVLFFNKQVLGGLTFHEEQPNGCSCSYLSSLFLANLSSFRYLFTYHFIHAFNTNI
jgi:hypothetical protein